LATEAVLGTKCLQIWDFLQAFRQQQALGDFLLNKTPVVDFGEWPTTMVSVDKMQNRYRSLLPG
jgi:hypothetical protein